MRYSYAVTLKRWAQLQLLIAIARTRRDGHKLEHNVGRVEHVDDENMTRSNGYRALRKWFHGLSGLAQSNAIRWMRSQLEGVAKLKARVEAQGDTFDYGELEMMFRDLKANDQTGELVHGPTFGDDAGRETTEEQGNVREHSDGDRQQQAPAQAGNPTDEARSGLEDRQDPQDVQRG